MEFLAVIGALFLLYLAIKSFPAVVSIFVGIGVVAIIAFVIAGIFVVLIPLLLIIALVMLILRLANR